MLNILRIFHQKLNININVRVKHLGPSLGGELVVYNTSFPKKINGEHLKKYCGHEKKGYFYLTNIKQDNRKIILPFVRNNSKGALY